MLIINREIQSKVNLTHFPANNFLNIQNIVCQQQKQIQVHRDS